MLLRRRLAALQKMAHQNASSACHACVRKPGCRRIGHWGQRHRGGRYGSSSATKARKPEGGTGMQANSVWPATSNPGGWTKPLYGVHQRVIDRQPIGPLHQPRFARSDPMWQKVAAWAAFFSDWRCSSLINQEKAGGVHSLLIRGSPEKCLQWGNALQAFLFHIGLFIGFCFPIFAPAKCRRVRKLRQEKRRQ